MDRPGDGKADDNGDGAAAAAAVEAARAPRWRDVSESGDNLAYEDFPSLRLGRLNTLIYREITSKYVDPSGLALPEWRVLARLSVHGSLEMRQLTRISLMDKAAISRSVDSLVSKGYAERHTDPANAKRRIVAITAAGRRLMRKVMPQAHRAQAKLLRLLTPQERVQFDAVITKLSRALLDGSTTE